MLNIKNETHQDVAKKPNGGAPGSVAQKLSGALWRRPSGTKSASGLPALLPKGGGTPSVIASDLTILGDIVCEDGAVTILGRVRGELRIADLTIGHGAQVTGNIYALTLHVKGDVSGTIHANHVKLARSATACVLMEARYPPLSCSGLSRA